MKKKYTIPFLIFTFAFLFFNCDNPDLTPSYLIITKEDMINCMDVSMYNEEHEEQLDQAQLEAIASQEFPNVWVYLNGQNLGCWEPPCKIPLLANFVDFNEIQIFPGVRMNTLSTQVPLYPFVIPFTFSALMSKEEIYTLEKNPIKFKYAPSVIFPLIETFEQSTSFSSLNPDGVGMVVSQENGENIGLISLTDTVNSFEVATVDYTLKGMGTYLFWELEYKCDNELFIQIRFINNKGVVEYAPLVNLKSTTVWRKAYINLTKKVSDSAGSIGYLKVNLVMNGLKNDIHPTNFYFKNIKLITLK